MIRSEVPKCLSCFTKKFKITMKFSSFHPNDVKGKTSSSCIRQQANLIFSCGSSCKTKSGFFIQLNNRKSSSRPLSSSVPFWPPPPPTQQRIFKKSILAKLLRIYGHKIYWVNNKWHCKILLIVSIQFCTLLALYSLYAQCLQIVQMGSGAHPAAYSMGIRLLSQGLETM
jgi:hypothetical protein